MGTIGNPKRVGKDVKRLIIDKESIVKPEQTYERIEKLVQGPYLNYLQEKQNPTGILGGLVGLFDKRVVKTRKRPSKWIETKEQLKLIS